MSSSDGQFVFVNTDPIAILVKNRAAHVPAGVSTANWLASALVLDALELGCRQVSALAVDGWNLVGAETNWVKRGEGENLDLPTIFRRILVFHRKSHGVTRHEGFLTAYAEDIMVVEGALVHRIKGADLPADILSVAAGSPFCIAFRAAEHSLPAGGGV
jgi:hypothetical protein